jgi:hypothetical protein
VTKPVGTEPTLFEQLGSGLAIATMTARLLVPTEATARGETLWITVLLLAATAIFATGRWQSGHRPKFDMFSVSVFLLVVGHLISGAWILGTEGHKRAALNVMWEWVSIGGTCYVLRGNRSAVRVLIAMCVVLAGYGVWQYFVDFPALRSEWTSSTTSASEFGDVSSGRELSLRGIPQTESARRLFADRLASLEPLGPFALTNTLAGFLATGTLFIAIVLLKRRRSVGQSVIAVALLGLLGYCLVLTKSRTAVAGALAALVLFGVFSLLRKRRSAANEKVDANGDVVGRGRWVSFGVVAIVLLTVVAAVATGGLDEQVISESPKSLRYRLMYWQGSIAALTESPLLGTGPGNFRQKYTPHKLAASSEEILDPHNMFLDAWCNAGLVGLLGLLMLVIVVTRSLFHEAIDESESGPPITGLRSGLVGFGLVLVQQFLTGQERPLLSLGLIIGFVVAWFAIRFLLAGASQNTVLVATRIAVVGLMVHLLGAGGFEMPAVAQVLILLAGALVPAACLQPSRGWFHLALAPVGIGCVVACLLTAAIPVTKATYLIQRGNMRGGDGALRDHAEADLADPLSPMAPRLLGQRLLADGGNAADVLKALEEARDRDPHSFYSHYALGMTMWQLWSVSQEKSDLEAAAMHLQTAVKRYPTNPRIVGDLAIVQDECGYAEAAANATKALQLDEINRQNGHQDRFLPEEFLSQLKIVSQRKKIIAEEP